MNILLWILQGLLTAIFLLAGVMKFVMPAEQITKGTPLPYWFLLLIGALEIIGAFGLILPAIMRIRPALTPLAAVCLCIIVVGATVLTFPQGAAMALFPFVTAILAAFVAYGRWRLVPIHPSVKSAA
jgi:uncharacterized membrane protein